jgi:hypothetical protein
MTKASGKNPYRIRKGEYAYTAPKFRDYLLRAVAER